MAQCKPSFASREQAAENVQILSSRPLGRREDRAAAMSFLAAAWMSDGAEGCGLSERLARQQAGRLSTRDCPGLQGVRLCSRGSGQGSSSS